MVAKISVIIPACNEEKYIKKTLNSLKNQTTSQFEVIVVCNGCTDNTKEVAEQFAVQILESKEANVSKARNLGAKHARGEILVFLDADTILETDALKTVRRGFSQKQSVATTLLQPDTTKLSHHYAIKFKNFYNTKNFYQGCSGVLICRKDDFEKAGKYPELHVREHRKLTVELMKLGEYKVITTTATTSMRRYNQLGMSNVFFFWVKQWGKDKVNKLNDSNYTRIR